MIVGTEHEYAKYCLLISFHLDFSITFKWKYLFEQVQINFGYQVMGLSWLEEETQGYHVFYNQNSRFFIHPINKDEKLLTKIVSHKDNTITSIKTLTLPIKNRCIDGFNKLIQYTPSEDSPIFFQNKLQYSEAKPIPFVFWPKLQIGYRLIYDFDYHSAENNEHLYFSYYSSKQRLYGLYSLWSNGNIYAVIVNNRHYTHNGLNKISFLSDNVFLITTTTITELVSFIIGSTPRMSIKS